MTALIESSYTDVRRFAAKCLALVSPALAQEFLFDLLIDEKVEVRAEALRSAGIRQPPQWIVIMERSLQDEELLIQRIALESLLNDRKGIPVLLKFVQKNPSHLLCAIIRAEFASRNFVVP